MQSWGWFQCTCACAGSSALQLPVRWCAVKRRPSSSSSSSSRKASDASLKLQIRCVILIAEIDALLMLLMGFPTRSTDTALNVMI